ncbi:MAG: hypothetical protein IKJ24_04555 [Clostridia bacterium]|nr:hypothetical protein [Clostridia bacterium]
MKTLVKVLLCITLSFMCLFTSIGYAAVSGNLAIHGTVEYTLPKMVYITSVSVKESSKTSGSTPAVEKVGFVMFDHSGYTLNTQSSYNRAGGSVTIEVTVKNNSGVEQYFTGLSNTPALANNAVVSYSNIGVGEKLAADETRTFTITIQNTSWSQTVNMSGVQSALGFSPSFDDTATENVSRDIASIFANVLAGKGVDGNGTGIVFQGREVPASEIVSLIFDNMENVDTGGYMGNVGNASDERKELIYAIFGDHITMEIGNQYYTVSILIKNQQIDGRGANDMVLYVTADQLAVGGGAWRNNAWRDLNIVPVYGLVFINNGNDNYSYCDHLFAGEAPVCSFSGAFGAGNVGNFNTNLWNSTEYADLTDTSGGSITQDYITTNGELDEAYQRYIRNQ